MALEEKEAEALAQSIANVAQHYPLVSRGMTPEGQAWASLLTTVAAVYGPKAMPHVIKRAMKPKAPKPGKAPTFNGVPVQ